MGSMQVEVLVLEDVERAVGLIGQLPNATVVDVDQGAISVQMTGGPRELAGLNTYLVQAGIEVASLCERRTNLEDLFMKISGEAS
jgi:hypothetical protein